MVEPVQKHENQLTRAEKAIQDAQAQLAVALEHVQRAYQTFEKVVETSGS